MKEVQLFERALDSIHTVSNVSVVAPSLEGQLVFVHGPLSVDEVGGAMIVGSVAYVHMYICTYIRTYVQ